jgi:hypothetical protein
MLRGKSSEALSDWLKAMHSWSKNPGPTKTKAIMKKKTKKTQKRKTKTKSKPKAVDKYTKQIEKNPGS